MVWLKIKNKKTWASFVRLTLYLMLPLFPFSFEWNKEPFQPSPSQSSAFFSWCWRTFNLMLNFSCLETPNPPLALCIRIVLEWKTISKGMLWITMFQSSKRDSKRAIYSLRIEKGAFHIFGDKTHHLFALNDVK